MTGPRQRPIALDLPDPPGPMGVVTDRHDIAWQRVSDVPYPDRHAPGGLVFVRPTHGNVLHPDLPTALPWAELLATRGPVRERWEGHPEPPESPA